MAERKKGALDRSISSGSVQLVLKGSPPLRHRGSHSSPVPHGDPSGSVALTNAIESSQITNFSLGTFCDFIDAHPALSSSEIVSCSGYAQFTGIVKHRFLILEVRLKQLEKSRTLWVRLDRRMDRSVGMLRFLAAGGKTPSNDTVQVATQQGHLLGGHFLKRENEQEYGPPPQMKEFRTFLEAVEKEVRQYKIWPENCWMFVAIMQHRLAEGRTVFVRHGVLKHVELGRPVDLRINTRIQVQLNLPSMIYMLTSLQDIGTDEMQIELNTAMRLATRFFESTDTGRTPLLEATDALASSLMQLASKTDGDVRTFSAFEPIAAASVSLYRQLQLRGTPKDWLHLMYALHMQNAASRLMDTPLSELSWSTNEEALNVARTVDGDPAWTGMECRFCSRPADDEQNLVTFKRILSAYGVSSLDPTAFLVVPSSRDSSPFLKPSEFDTTADILRVIPLRVEDPDYDWGITIDNACTYGDYLDAPTPDDYISRVSISKCVFVLGQSYLEGRMFDKACNCLHEALAYFEEFINLGILSRRGISRKAMKRQCAWFIEGLHAYGVALRLAGRLAEGCDVLGKLFALIRMFDSRSVHVGEDLAMLGESYGAVLHSLEDFDKAVDVYQIGYDAAVVDRHMAKMLQGRACALYRLGDLNGARQSFNEAIALLRDHLSGTVTPDRTEMTTPNLRGCTALAFLLRDSGVFSVQTRDMARALDALGQSFGLFLHLAKYTQLDPDDEIDYIKEMSAAADLYSSVLRSEGRLADAVTVHKQAADLMPNTAPEGAEGSDNSEKDEEASLEEEEAMVFALLNLAITGSEEAGISVDGSAPNIQETWSSPSLTL